MKFKPLAYSEEQLLRLAADKQLEYTTADPFSHIVLDQVFDHDMLNKVIGEFQAWNADKKIRYKDPEQVKIASLGRTALQPISKDLLDYLNAPVFVQFLETLTGIPDLIPDPDFSGGGYHEIEPGGFLNIHADFFKHPQQEWHRRVNVLIYLNHDWDESYGGQLELWDKGMQNAVQKVLPIFNRMVIFSTTTDSYHGHPDPLQSPLGQTRKSLALYYYTKDRPQEEQDGALLNTTLFQVRPGHQEDLWAHRHNQRKMKIRQWIKYVLPEGLVRFLRAMKRDQTDLRR